MTPVEIERLCRDVFGAVEGVRRPCPDERPVHAMLLFGPSMLMIEAESPTLPSRAPQPDGSSSVVIPLKQSNMFVTVASVRSGCRDNLECAVAGQLPIVRI